MIVDRNNVVVVTGFNGHEPGGKSCLKGDCPRGRLTYRELPPGGDYGSCTGIHAEDNALRFAKQANQMKRVFGSTCYITRAPCKDCQQLLKHHGVGMAVWPGGEMEF